MSSVLLSSGHDFGASKCIDSIVNNDNGWNFCMSELYQPRPWISVQLNPGTAVLRVTLIPREDPWQSLLGQYEVRAYHDSCEQLCIAVSVA